MKIEVTSTFRDDHLPCVSFTYGERKLTLWWTDAKTIGALMFTDSPTAQEYLKPLFDAIEANNPITEDLDATFTTFGHLQEGEE